MPLPGSKESDFLSAARRVTGPQRLQHQGGQGRSFTPVNSLNRIMSPPGDCPYLGRGTSGHLVGRGRGSPGQGCSLATRDHHSPEARAAADSCPGLSITVFVPLIWKLGFPSLRHLPGALKNISTAASMQTAKCALCPPTPCQRVQTSAPGLQCLAGPGRENTHILKPNVQGIPGPTEPL